VKKMKTVLIALIAVIALVGVVLVAKGYPDWNYQILPMEGAVFEITGNVDANITNAQINVNITNSEITVTPKDDAVFTIEPASGVTFNISGDVDATIQGTADVNIKNAEITINVATIHEVASASGLVEFHGQNFDFTSAGTQEKTVYTNNESYGVFLEVITGSWSPFGTSDLLTSPTSLRFQIGIWDEHDNVIAIFTANQNNLPISLDPAIKLNPGWKVVVDCDLYENKAGTAYIEVLIRK